MGYINLTEEKEKFGCLTANWDLWENGCSHVDIEAGECNIMRLHGVITNEEIKALEEDEGREYIWDVIEMQREQVAALLNFIGSEMCWGHGKSVWPTH